MSKGWEDSGEARKALHVALQNIVREFEEDSLIVGCFLTLEVVNGAGKKYLMHRSFDVNGENLLSWYAEGYVRDALRSIDEQAKGWIIDAEGDDEDGKEEDEDE